MAPAFVRRTEEGLVGASATIGRHTIGNALVLHARERISAEARSLALTIHEDADNDIVVLDLHDDLPVGIWELVAGALHRRRRGIRVVVCGTGQDTAVLAGQWLSDRLRRSVVAPYGQVIRGASGGLFVHAAEGSGWVRYGPGKPPVWEAKRYPRPAWDGAAVDFQPTSAVGAVEPLPGGVWIRDTRDATAVSGHWRRLAKGLPCQPQSLTVVLGCPGTPPLPLDDVARFWRELDKANRDRVRFVHYGPVRLPAGEALGQVLADLFKCPIICFTGVPMGRPARPQMYTVTPGGALGWQVFARELGYTPRKKPTMPARTPHILSHRAPVALGDAVGPLVYRYADDAVIEIVQSGLWIRDETAPGHAERVRARPADPVLHAVVVDDADPARVVRYRELAEDLVARLDPATRGRSTLHLASAVVTGMRGPSAAGGTVPDGATYRYSRADLALETAERAAPAVAPAEQLVSLAVAGPDLTPVAQVRATLEAPTPGRAGGNLTAGQHRKADRGATADVPVPLVPPGPGPRPDREAAVPLWTDAVTPVSPAPAGSSRPTPAHRGPRRAKPARDLSRPEAGELASRSALPPSPSSPDSQMLTPDVAVRVPDALAHAPDTSGARLPATPPDAVTGVPGLDRRGRDASTRGSLRVRFQATPEPGARGLVTVHGLAEERAWLRSSFSPEFDSAARSVSCILAEHPGFQAGRDTMADSVAVRLYLSELGDGLDATLRYGAIGPQVPFARCVSGGLGRLPSYRGATVLAADLTADDLHDIRRRQTLTDWGFTHALTEPPGNLPGNVDVLIWSMTARRTRLLEPDGEYHVDNRVVFLPGTCFKVLDAAERGPASRGRLLLRELSADEQAHGHVPFDDLALSGLRRAVEQWADSSARTRVASAAIERFTVPGLA